MKLVEYTTWCVRTLGEKDASAAEILRALREGSSHFGKDAAFLKGKPGVGGAMRADDFNTSFFLLGVMLGGKRADLCTRVWHVWHLGDDRPANYAGEERDPHFDNPPLFGDMLRLLMRETNLARRVEKIRVSMDWAEVIWADSVLPSIFGEPAKRPNTPLFRIVSLDGGTLAELSLGLKVGDIFSP
jgi:hypothetical protein